MIVDSNTFYGEESKISKPAVGKASDGVPDGVSPCLCHVCVKYNANPNKEKTSVFSGYDEIYPEVTNELTAHQYLICSDSVYAYILEARAWGESI